MCIARPVCRATSSRRSFGTRAWVEENRAKQIVAQPRAKNHTLERIGRRGTSKQYLIQKVTDRPFCSPQCTYGTQAVQDILDSAIYDNHFRHIAAGSGESYGDGATH